MMRLDQNSEIKFLKKWLQRQLASMAYSMSIDSTTLKLNKKLTTAILKDYQPTSKVLQKIQDIILSHDKFVLTTHENADADGIGAEIGLYFLLKKLKKKCIILNNEALKSSSTLYSQGLPILNYENDDDRYKAIKFFENGFLFILDNSEIKRCQKIFDLASTHQCSWATIDHHIVSKKKNYCVDADYAATCELIWDLYYQFKIPIVAKAALPMYVGLIADSGNFRYSKTSLRTHLAGGDLLRFNIDSDQVYRHLYESQPPDRLTYLGRIFKTLEVNKKKKYAVALSTLASKEGLELGDSPNEGIVNILLSVEGIHVAALLTETDDGQLKSSIRSIGKVSARDIAVKFGGGGHFNASGLRINKPFKIAKAMLLKEIKKANLS